MFVLLECFYVCLPIVMIFNVFFFKSIPKVLFIRWYKVNNFVILIESRWLQTVVNTVILHFKHTIYSHFSTNKREIIYFFMSIYTIWQWKDFFFHIYFDIDSMRMKFGKSQTIYDNDPFRVWIWCNSAAHRK